MLGVILGAAVLWLIIFTMEGETLDWFPIICCLLATIIPTAIVNSMVPPALFFVGPIVGALVGGVAISAMCGMTFKRAAIAAGGYLMFQIAFEVIIMLMSGGR